MISNCRYHDPLQPDQILLVGDEYEVLRECLELLDDGSFDGVMEQYWSHKMSNAAELLGCSRDE